MKIRIKTREQLQRDTSLYGDDLESISKYSGLEFDNVEVLGTDTRFEGAYQLPASAGAGIFLPNEVEVIE